MKAITDLTRYKSILPYASEMFGVFQPLLGWKSQRQMERIEAGLSRDRKGIINDLKNSMVGSAQFQLKENFVPVTQIDIGSANSSQYRRTDSVLLAEITKKLPPPDSYTPDIWHAALQADNIRKILKENVTKSYTEAFSEKVKQHTPREAVKSKTSTKVIENLAETFSREMNRESAIAGLLMHLHKHRKVELLRELFYVSNSKDEKVTQLLNLVSAPDTETALMALHGATSDINAELLNVIVSPIGVVHLFRQYFFELDSFLGPPVHHVWLSPGSSVELIETHTRRTLMERTLETSLETIMRNSRTTVDQVELSEAIKQNNQQDIKFGASVTASYSSIEASTSFDFSTSQQSAREATHKRMRQQTETLSSEIRKNVVSTFKTTSEFTDVSSAKYVLANTTDKLINYEMRRKMRQVGIQVQDVGTYLCWQTYVDDPGINLGLGKLVHIATPPDLGGLTHPAGIPLLEQFAEQRMITIPFISVAGGADNSGEVYRDGVEVNDEETWGELEKIQSDFEFEFVCPKSDYTLENIEFDSMGKPVMISLQGRLSETVDGKCKVKLHLDSADFQGQNSVQVNIILHWTPLSSANDAIKVANAAKLTEFQEEEKAAYEKAMLDATRERINAASRINSRTYDELREEERIVVYRKLIQDMLMKGIEVPDDKTRHAIAELINSIFDVDKMLYYVAPEWWRPRLHRSKQQLQETPEKKVFPRPEFGDVFSGAPMVMAKTVGDDGAAVMKATLSSSTIGWGGIHESNRDNYYITEESAPARFGSSLGWLLQLDGDNMRNAFLNAPWVKTVIPVRPGKEDLAINWLKSVEGLNGISDDVIYQTNNPNEKSITGEPLNGMKLIDVLLDLSKKIKQKYDKGIETGSYPVQSEISDPALVDEDSVVTSTPIDRVYEHGFYPLANSFKANVDSHYEIFDQWLEILPTDQIVPVEVKYDPLTGRQI